MPAAGEQSSLLLRRILDPVLVGGRSRTDLATAVAAGYASTGEHVQAKQDAAAQAASFESHAARWRHSTTRFQERQRQRRQ